MKRLSLIIALMIALNWSGPARAELNLLTQCTGAFTFKSTTYDRFRKAIDVQQKDIISFWLSGLVTGLSLKSEVCSDRILACMDNTSASQRLAMLEKIAKDSPEKWGAASIFSLYMFDAFVHPCLEGEIPLQEKK